MEGTRTRTPAPEVLAEVTALLDHLDPDLGMLSDADQLDLLVTARRLAGRLQALAATVAAAVAASQAADRQVGVPLASWLAATQRLTRREAHRLIGQGTDLTRFPHLTQATLEGRVGFEQATAIATVLTRLPDDLTTNQLTHAENAMLGYAAEFDSAGLARLSRHLVEVLDPGGVDERDATRLDRDLKHAKATRHLTFLPDGHGSVVIKGSLPTLDAEPLITLIDAYTQAERRNALDRLDPLVETVTPAMRRADALCALIAAHQHGSLAPSYGGDRPRIIVTLDYDRLHDQVTRAGLLRTGDPITAGQLRQLACDADLLPAILGGPSQVLDVGRTQRLVTPTLRTALTLRDQGCVFPGCDKPPGACHAHHLTPWWQGGSTSLQNLALLCPHHHGLIEPARDRPPDTEQSADDDQRHRRWELRIATDGTPETLPPHHIDPTRQPRRHQRFRTPPARDGGNK